MVQRQGVIAAPDFDKTAKEGKQVNHQREHQPRPCHAHAQPAHANRQGHGHSRIAFAGHGREAAAPQQTPLHKKDRQGKHTEDEGQRGRHARVERCAHDGKENFGRQHRVRAPQNDGVAKVGHALNEAHQKRIRQAGLEQGQGHGGESAPATGTQRLRRFLQGRTDPLHHTAHDHESDRGEGEHLRQPDPKNAVEPARRWDAEGPLHELVVQARAAKQQNQTQAHHKWRNDDGQHGQYIEGARKSGLPALGPQRHQGAHEGGASGGQQGQVERVPRHATAALLPDTPQPPNAFGGQAFDQCARRKHAHVVIKRRHQRARHRVHHKQRQQGHTQQHR